MRLCWAVYLAVLALVTSGCALFKGAAMVFVYKKAPLTTAQVHLDIPYSDSKSPKNRLDLFLPTGTNWPVMVFVYGGGWTEGDKSFKFGGDDVYGNIGRFYAARGVGVAVINYRLLPQVKWQEQISDVARATAWAYDHIAGYGGDRRRFFLCGHSAGAQLVDRIALDVKPLTDTGHSPKIISGVISVSGAGLDMTDQLTYTLGESPAYFAKRFATDPQPGDWQKIASPVTYIRAESPPFLILYAGGETKALIRQSQHFSDVLTQAGVQNNLVMVPGQSHARMVLALSRDDKTAGPAVLEFINSLHR